MLNVQRLCVVDAVLCGIFFNETTFRHESFPEWTKRAAEGMATEVSRALFLGNK